MTNPPDILASFTSYEGMVSAFRARRMALGLSQLAVDDIAGLPSGYTAKIEMSVSNPGAKNARSIGKESLPLMLGALGLEMGIIEPASKSSSCAKYGSAYKGLLLISQQKRAENARIGGKRAWRNRTEAEQRKTIDRMNRARVQKARERKVKKVAAKPKAPTS